MAVAGYSKPSLVTFPARREVFTLYPHGAVLLNGGHVLKSIANLVFALRKRRQMAGYRCVNSVTRVDERCQICTTLRRICYFGYERESERNLFVNADSAFPCGGALGWVHPLRARAAGSAQRVAVCALSMQQDPD